MARLIFEGLTMKQAEVLADWYEGQGEQDAEVWCSDRDVETPISDVSRKGGCTKIDGKKQEVTLYCK